MNAIIRFFGDIAINWWCAWSNYRFKDAERFNTETDAEDKIRRFTDITKLACKIEENYTWTADGLDQLGDAITPPPELYKIYKNARIKDDCDGFHALMYHCFYQSGIQCYLLTANARGGGHCILLFEFNGKWYVLDYTHVTEGFAFAEDAIKNYNKIYVGKYKTKSNVFYNGLVEYNYFTGKFSRVSIKKLRS